MLSLVAWFAGADKFKNPPRFEDILPKRSTDEGFVSSSQRGQDGEDMAAKNADAQSKASRAMLLFKLKAIDRVRRRGERHDQGH